MDKIYRFAEARNISTEEQRKQAEETRTIDFVISSNAKDRHGTRMNMDNWKLGNFNSNPIVGYQHDVYGGNMCSKPDPDDVIGKGRAWIEDNEDQTLLIGSVTFETADINQKADKIFRKVLFGSLRAASVGILPIGEGRFGEGNEAVGEDNETWYFAGQELLEFSVVNLPSNTEALKRNMALQAETGIEYLKKYVSDNIKRDVDIYEMKVAEVLEMLEGKIDNYFARIKEKELTPKEDVVKEPIEIKVDNLRKIIDEVKSDIKKTIEQDEKPDLDLYFKKLQLEILNK